METTILTILADGTHRVSHLYYATNAMARGRQIVVTVAEQQRCNDTAVLIVVVVTGTVINVYEGGEVDALANGLVRS